MTNYNQAGVHNDKKAIISKMFYEAMSATWVNRKGVFGEVVIPFDRFSGIRGMDVSMLPPGTMMGTCPDGIGTKVNLAEMMDDHTTMGYNLLAMCCDDAVVLGAEPIGFVSEFQTRTLEGEDKKILFKQIKQVMQGYIAAAKATKIAVLGGETSELGDRVGGFGPFNYNWGGTAIWFARRDRLLTGEKIRPGDDIVGLMELGFRSNGFSLVRTTFGNKYGPDWVPVIFSEGKTLGDAAIVPSIIYTRAAVEMFGGYQGEPKIDVHKIIHITGEGMPGKVGRGIEASGYGVEINDPFAPPPIMLHCQEAGNVPDRDAYDTFNMGQGMAIITPSSDSKGAIAIANQYGIEAKVIGHVTQKKGIYIKNKGFFGKGEMLPF